jgi:hypothetical protein
MSKIFRVDIPTDAGAGEEWTYINEFSNRDEAIAFCMAEFGSDNQGRINLITEDDDALDADEVDPAIVIPLSDIDDDETTAVVHVTRLSTDQEESAIQDAAQARANDRDGFDEY